MRFKVILKPLSRGVVPWNYQNYIASFIYNVLKEGDPELSEAIHQGVKKVEGKPIKPFCFSWLSFPLGIKKMSEGFKPNSSGMAEFFISSPVEEFSRTLVGWLWGKTMQLGRISFMVSSVELVPTPDFSSRMSILKTLTPLVSPIIENPGDMNTPPKRVFLHPHDPRFIEVIANNLKRKYQFIYDTYPSEPAVIELVKSDKQPFSKLVDIKGTKIRGYLMSIKVAGPAPMIKLAYEMGLGSYNSQGFGMVDVI